MYPKRRDCDKTFNDDHAAMANLKIWDVVNNLDQLNKGCDYVTDSEFKKFKDGSNKLNNLIRTEISGKEERKKLFIHLSSYTQGIKL